MDSLFTLVEKYGTDKSLSGYTSHEPYMGWNDSAIGPRFFIPQEFINKRIIWT